MSDILQKLGSAAKGAASKLKTLPPGESEAQGIKAISDQVDSLKEPTTATTTNETQRGEGTEPMPMGKYGSRADEKRIDTSSYYNSAIKAPVYDNGGEVSMAAAKQAQSAGDSALQSYTNAPDEPTPAKATPTAPPAGGGLLQMGVDKYAQSKQDAINRVTTDRGDNVMKPAYMPGGGPSAAAPAMPLIQPSSAPVFDEGGEVAPDVNDGKHQVAIVKEGERVLTPEQNAQYKKEHPEVEEKGAPADFGGPVLPNPKNVKPRWDTDPVTPKTYPGGAKMSIDNANVDEGSGDAEHFPTVIPKTTSANTPVLKPYSKALEDKAAQKTAVQAPHSGIEPSTSDVEGQIPEDGAPVEEKPKKTYGTLLADHWLKTNGLPSTEGSNQNTPAEGTQTPPTTPTSGVMPRYGGPGKPVAQGELLPKEQLAKDEQKYADTPEQRDQRNADRKSKVADLEKQRQAALASGDLATADKLAVAKAQLEKTPWADRSGWSKFGKIASTVGNVAGDVLNPNIMAAIPGTDLNKHIQETGMQGRLATDQKAAIEQQNANTAENSAKNAGTNGQQYAQSLRDLAAAEATHDPAKIAVAQRAADDAKKALDESKPVAKVPTGDEPLGPELVTQYNKELADRYQVLNPGKQLPQEFMLPPTATANDYNRRHTAMEGVEKATGVKTQQDTTNEQKTAAAAVHKEEHAGKLYDDYTKQVEKNSAPMEAISARTTLLLHNLDAKDKQSDAQVAPELLSIASGGVGSGLRMNEAEISRVIGGRSVWDSLIAMANKVREGEGTFSDEQRLQMHKIGEYIYDRAAAVTTVYSDVKDRMLTDKDRPDQVRKDYNDAKRIANQIVRQGIVPQGGTPKDGDFVFHNGQVLIVKGGKGYPALQ